MEEVGSAHFELAWHHELTQGINDVYFTVSLRYVQLRQSAITPWGENVTSVNRVMWQSLLHSTPIQANCSEARPDSSKSKGVSLGQTGLFAHKGIVVGRDSASMTFQHVKPDTAYTCAVQTRFNNSDASSTAENMVSVHTLPASEHGSSQNLLSLHMPCSHERAYGVMLMCGRGQEFRLVLPPLK